MRQSTKGDQLRSHIGTDSENNGTVVHIGSASRDLTAAARIGEGGAR